MLLRCDACEHEYTADRVEVPCPRCGVVDRASYREAPATEPGTGAIVGGYRLEKRVGDGATSSVYKAIDPARDGTVAVKVLSRSEAVDREAIERFTREARLARRLKHPHLVHVHDSGVDDETGAHYIVMDLVEGLSLDALVERDGPLPWRRAAEFVCQVAAAVEHLHGHGCVHRDIKPGNILIGDGVAKLTDLGFVKPESESPKENETLIMGTPSYMAPEQVVDAREAGPAADVYALGATLFFAVTGRAPFQGANAEEIMGKVEKERPVSVTTLATGLPPPLASLIEWAMAKDVGDRPESATSFAQSLAAIVADPRATSALARRHRHHPLAMAAMLLIAVLCVVFFVAMLAGM
jgi:eukaryotic-like serine/threonine-protein kinase